MSESKLQKLKTVLKSYKSVVIAFSGGTDSTFLLHSASQIPGLSVIAVTVKTAYVPDWEMKEAIDFCKTNNMNHRLIELPFPEIIRDNPVERCYLCKKSLFSHIISFAEENGYAYVADGTNADDTGDFRPGLKALSELSVKSPLLEASLTKIEIRELSERDGLPIWNKPPYACLLTRIPYNKTVNKEMQRKIEEAEIFIKELRFPGTRVRINGEESRLECRPAFLEKIIEKDNRDYYSKKVKRNWV